MIHFNGIISNCQKIFFKINILIWICTFFLISCGNLDRKEIKKNENIIVYMENTMFLEIPNLDRNPLFNKEINPDRNQKINPNENSLLNPALNTAINPNENPSINPMKNEMIHPGIKKEWSYMDNESINPKLTQEINPSYVTKLNPNSAEFEGKYIFDRHHVVKEFACNISSEIWLIYNTKFELSKIAVTNKNNGFNLFSTHHEWIGFMIPDENGGFLLFDTKCGWEFYAA